MKTKRTTPKPAAAPKKAKISPELEEKNRQFRLLEKRWQQRIHWDRPVPPKIQAEAHQELDAVLECGDRDLMLCAILNLHAWADFADRWM
jgi:hypothetical protein